MARKQWTLLVRSGDRTAARQVRVSPGAALTSIAGAIVLVSVLGALGTRVLSDGIDAIRHQGVRVELAAMESEIDSLGAALADLEEKDAFYRLLAGLDPIDPAIREVGLAASGFETPEMHPLYESDIELAGRAHGATTELSALVRRARLLSWSWREARQTLQQKVARLQATPSILPANGWISSGFSASRWHPILSRPRPHLGLDIVAPDGSPIVAPARGRVRRVGNRGEYGLTIEIDHGFGTVTRYAHASRALVRVGQPVERGDVIGFVGATGLALGPHLHYEVIVQGRPTNPRRFIFEASAMPD